MEYMFYKCNSLTELLLDFSTKNVINMSGMFCKCYSLLELKISYFETKNVINMNKMFEGCKKIKELDLLRFNLENVTNMSYMFNEYQSLYHLKMSIFTEKVIDISGMFRECIKLKEFSDLSDL